MIDPQAESILLAYINATPAMLSLLFDCDLLPEQLKRDTQDWDRMLYIADHWRAREKGFSADHANFKLTEAPKEKHG